MRSITRQIHRGVQGRLSQASTYLICEIQELLVKVIQLDLLLVELVDPAASCTQIGHELAMLPDQVLDCIRSGPAGEECSLLEGC